MYFTSICAAVLWDAGHKRRTGNTHNYHVNEGAGACRGQLARRCAKSRQTLQSFYWAALTSPGSGERGMGGSLLDPISHPNILRWIHAKMMQLT